ncbi:hypothetical protein ATANTOWER_004656 [Ataeniobius toweri]|uniref:Uncharacterized protein n=1 Tax=Ataeniobius toweri TaxID=208326 RepID=A0ABU7BC01_9TELE|nr:hypothetical protein [Ataeniobius toweri]
MDGISRRCRGEEGVGFGTSESQSCFLPMIVHKVWIMTQRTRSCRPAAAMCFILRLAGLRGRVRSAMFYYLYIKIKEGLEVVWPSDQGASWAFWRFSRQVSKVEDPGVDQELAEKDYTILQVSGISKNDIASSGGDGNFCVSLLDLLPLQLNFGKADHRFWNFTDNMISNYQFNLISEDHLKALLS